MYIYMYIYIYLFCILIEIKPNVLSENNEIGRFANNNKKRLLSIHVYEPHDGNKCRIWLFQLLLWLLPQAQEQIILRGGDLRHIRRARNKGLPKSYDRIASKRAENENPKELNGNQMNLPWSVDLMVVIIHNIVTVSPLKLMNWKWFQHSECQF